MLICSKEFMKVQRIRIPYKMYEKQGLQESTLRSKNLKRVYAATMNLFRGYIIRRFFFTVNKLSDGLTFSLHNTIFLLRNSIYLLSERLFCVQSRDVYSDGANTRVLHEDAIVYVARLSIFSLSLITSGG